MATLDVCRSLTVVRLKFLTTANLLAIVKQIQIGFYVISYIYLLELLLYNIFSSIIW